MQDYKSAITAKIGVNEAFERITRVSDWWTAGTHGSARKLGDEFTVRWGETFVTFKVTELVPGKRAVWLVTDCNVEGFKDKTEWKGTKVVWDLSSKNGETHVSMTHVGLVPTVACYALCESGWNFYVGESLLRLLTEGKGLPDQKGRSAQRAQA